MKITLKIHPHSQQDVEQLIRALQVLNQTDNFKPATQPVAQPAPATVKEQPKTAPALLKKAEFATPVATKQPAATQPVTETAVAETGAEQAPVTIEELRVMTAEKIKAGFREQIIQKISDISDAEKLKEAGKPSISTIASEKYVEYKTFLENLKNE